MPKSGCGPAACRAWQYRLYRRFLSALHNWINIAASNINPKDCYQAICITTAPINSCQTGLYAPKRRNGGERSSGGGGRRSGMSEFDQRRLCRDIT